MYPRGARALLAVVLSAAAFALPADAQPVPHGGVLPASISGSPAFEGSPLVVAEAPSVRTAAPNVAPRSLMLDARASALTLSARDSARSYMPAPLPRQDNTSRNNTALMLVGVAGVVLGAAVGGDAGTVLIIGGAGVGLFGLYRFLN